MVSVRCLVFGVSAVVLVSCGSVRDGDPLAGDDGPGDRAPAPAWITLVTGDRASVSVSSGVPAAAVEAGPGRAHITFSIQQRRGRVFVTPSDAAPLIAAGVVDNRLFDVTSLLELGYDDEHRASVPVVVTYRRGTERAAGHRAPPGAAMRQALPSVDGVALDVAKDRAAEVWGELAASTPRDGQPARASEIRGIWLDRMLHPALDHSISQIGAPAAYAAGYTGRGVTVAVLDSGFDPSHADLADQVAVSRNFTSDADATDHVGHGTHVASIVAGSGAASSGRYRGVAPGARLAIGKVCTAAGCPMSAVLAGIEWAVTEVSAPIVNLSLGGADTPGLDPLEEAVNRWSRERGTLFVIAAGNDGEFGEQTVGSPASADTALAVGAVDRDDVLAPFSSRGPRVGDAAIKPEITAPGVSIAAARAAGTAIGDVVDAAYTRLSGTSMAAPHVAGAAALLRQQHPTWNGAMLKAALIDTARPAAELTPFEQGGGRVDVAEAVAEPVIAEPAILDLGRPAWPHEDDPPVVKTVAFTNSSRVAIDLSLALESRDPDGAPAPPGMFSISPPTAALAPDGTVEVTVTADTRIAAPLGRFTGRVVATAGGRAIGIPFALELEGEVHDLVLSHLDQRGELAAAYDTVVVRIDGTDEPNVFAVYHPSGIVRLRMPRGRYAVYSFLRTAEGADGARPHQALVVAPSVDVTADTSLVLDSRVAKPVEIAAPGPRAELLLAAAGLLVRTTTSPSYSSFNFSPGADAAVGQIGPNGPEKELLSHINAQFAERGPTGELVDSPQFWGLSWTREGAFDGFVARVRPSELATVIADHRAVGTARQATKGVFPSTAGGFFTRLALSLPIRRVEHYLPDPGGWSRELLVQGRQSLSGLALYRAARVHREVWNSAVFGPAFPALPDQPVALRIGDVISSRIAMLSDGQGNLGDQNAVGVTRLFRGEALISERRVPGVVLVGVPSEPATYRIESDATRTSPEVTLATRVTAAWTFRSQTAPSQVALPLLAIRFEPALDDENRARAGSPFSIPIRIERMPGAPPAAIRSVTLDVSYDDGATWRPAWVLGVGTLRFAIVSHPASARFVSLRAHAEDASGSRVDQTVLHAYALR